MRDADVEPVRRLGDAEAEPLEDLGLLGARDRCAEQRLDARLAQAQMTRGARARAADVDRAADRPRPAQLDHQLRGQRLALHPLLGRELLLEAPGGLGAQRQPRRGALDVGPVPGRGLHQHARGAVVDLRARAAHDPGDARRPLGVVDHAHLGVEAALDVVEGGDRLAVPRAPHHEAPAGHEVGVEGVHRLARPAASRSW